MYLTEKINMFIERLKESDELKECKIFKAFPYVDAPTRPKNIMIAVGFDEISADNTELGGECLYGSYKIIADVYFPYGAVDTQEVIGAVINSQLSQYPSSVSVSSPECKDSLGCIRVKCSFTFYANMSFGGNNDE